MNFDEQQAENIFEKLKKIEIDVSTLNEAERKSTHLGDLYDDFIELLNIVKDALDGKFKIPFKTLAVIIGAVAYVALPFDALPDFLGPLGFIDDIAIVGMVIQSINDTLVEYRNFKKKNTTILKEKNEDVDITIDIKNKLI